MLVISLFILFPFSVIAYRLHRAHLPLVGILKSTPENENSLTDVSELITDLSKGVMPAPVFEKEIAKREALLSEKRSLEDKKKEIAATIGSGIVGLTAGTLLDISLLDKLDPLYPPILTSVLFAGGAYYARANLKENAAVTSVIDSLIAQPTILAGESIKKSVNNQIDSAKAAIDAKIESTTNYVLDTPNRTKKSLIVTVDKINDNIQKSVGNAITEVSLMFG